MDPPPLCSLKRYSRKALQVYSLPGFHDSLSLLRRTPAALARRGGSFLYSPFLIGYYNEARLPVASTVCLGHRSVAPPRR